MNINIITVIIVFCVILYDFNHILSTLMISNDIIDNSNKYQLNDSK